MTLCTAAIWLSIEFNFLMGVLLFSSLICQGGVTMDKLDNLVLRNWNSKVWLYIVCSIIIRILVQCISDVFFTAVNDFFSHPSEGGDCYWIT